MPKRSSNDPNQAGKRIVDAATSNREVREPEKNPAAVELGRLGGKKGGKARAEKLSAQRRKEIAQQAAKARWERERHG